jgi:hypothetical protein
MLGRIFPDDIKGREFAERVKDNRYFVKRYNRNVQIFVRNVQNRINGYVDFGLELMAYLDEQEEKQPARREFIARIKAEWSKPVWQYGEQLPNTKKCENEKIAIGYLTEFNKALRLDTVEQAMKGMCVGAIPHELGDPGDRRLRNIRRKTAVIRAMATMEMAMNPAAGEIAKEIRKRTEAALRNPHNYERVTVW